ncbi:type II secretion system F family protein [Kutzneria kofuensis]|uniref:Flp pilus assembly protein TadB n=1 Tax=Kutzneria kofuensis TaxID=103725 RepID=A0A7W9KGT7_9PSEU|nr:type II secretion system F family protein [Kutzneria kofuensis]MBB5892337.1 Flp pilus assembly protein TadB [Kutzneria kofuensis]
METAVSGGSGIGGPPMIGYAASAFLLSLALLVLPGPITARVRLALVFGPSEAAARHGPRLPAEWLPALVGISAGVPAGMLFGWVPALVVSVVAFLWCRRTTRRGPPPPDPLTLAATWDLLAASLRAGLPVPTAIRAVASVAPPGCADVLRRTAELLALGSDPVQAWAPALADPATEPLARGARRSARSGTALAEVADGLAQRIRATAADTAEVRAQRAAVLITGPLGLCFLPAFLCLGVVPVVVGLAGRLLISW